MPAGSDIDWTTVSGLTPTTAVTAGPPPPEFLIRTSLGGSTPGRKSFAFSDWFFTALDRTAFFFSSAAPTLCLGIAASAYPVPPSATSRAQTATTRAGEGRREVRRVAFWDMSPCSEPQRPRA